MNTKKVKMALQDSLKVSSLKLPEERHQFVLYWNWDDGVKPLQWIVEQPDTDKGTALYIYWLSNPGDVHVHSEIATLISTIENNVKTNFYKNENILFDPSNNHVIDYPKVNKETIPEQMLKATKGKQVELANLENTYVNRIYKLSDKERVSLEENITAGSQALEAFDANITVADSSPDDVIHALQKLSNSFRTQNKEKFSPQESKMFKQLDYLWGDQVSKKFNYAWYLHEVHEQVLDFVEYILVSPDRKYYWHDFGNFMKDYSKSGGESTLIIDSYQQFEHLDKDVQAKLDKYKKEHPDATADDILLFARPYPNGISAVKQVAETEW